MHSLGIAYVEISVGKAENAERRLRVAREFLGSLGNVWWIDLVDGCICDAVGAQDRPREFLRLVDAFSASVQMTDRATLVGRQLLLARAHLLRGSAPEAEAAARRALALSEPSDALPKHANALLMLAEVLDARDQSDDAAAARSHAIAKLRAKGNLAAVARLSNR